MARHFFALRPGEAAAASLAGVGRELEARLSGRAVPASNLHLTLAFLGEIDAASLVQASRIEAPRAPAMDLAVDCIGCFHRARVAWAGMLMPPAALFSLQSDLASELARRGLQIEDRAFAPHVTLVRKIAKPLQRESIATIGWRSEVLVLMRSDAGSARYAEVHSWCLGGR